MWSIFAAIGRLTKDPELNHVSGKNGETFPVCNFSIVSDDPDDPDNPDFYSVVAWGRMAENVVKHLGKGRLVLVQGRYKVKKFQRQDGSTGYRHEIQAKNIRYLDSKPKNDQQPQEANGFVPMDHPQQPPMNQPGFGGQPQFPNQPQNGYYQQQNGFNPYQGAPQPNGFGGQQQGGFSQTQAFQGNNGASNGGRSLPF